MATNKTSDERADEIFNGIKISDCETLSNPPSENTTPSPSAKLDTSEKAKAATNGKGMNRNYPNGDQAKFTSTLLTTIKVKVNTSKGEKTLSVQFNKVCADDFKKAMNEVFNLKINGKSFQCNSLGTYCHRNIAGKSRLSYHSYGVAFDINPDNNPFFKKTRYPSGANTITNIRTGHPIIDIFKKYGFGWGGRYGDTMHFSWFNGD